MQIMTEAYKDRQYFIPLNPEKTDGLYARPLSATERRKISQEAMLEAGGDILMSAWLECVKTLQAGLTGWKGMVDMGGNEIPFTPENLKLCAEHDPDVMAGFMRRLHNVARYGEEDDAKN